MRWLREDCPFSDLTSEFIVDDNVYVRAVVISKSHAIAACVEDIVEILKWLGINVIRHVSSGTALKPGDIVMEIYGKARTILLVERTILNLLTHLFGVATTTRKIVDVIRRINPKVRIAATRKIIPGLRYLVKKAVAYGGGDTHRFSLSDAVLIKDNHLKIIGDVEKAIRLVKERVSFIHKVEIEVTNVNEAIKAAKAGADIIMLDNMSVNEVKKVIDKLKKLGLRSKVIIEVSGGITPKNVTEYARLDVDVISMSYITMNPERIDLSLEVTEVRKG